jgi:ubiquinone/menaquinone biosynthesis C-methylase UbiE
MLGEWQCFSSSQRKSLPGVRTAFRDLSAETKMEQSVTNRHFKFMSLSFKIRDLLLPRDHILNEVGIKSGFQVLDYGCGTGSYAVVASKMVGTSGTVYALDIHPLAIEYVKKRVSKEHLNNIRTLISGRDTGLPDNSMDIVLLYDIFHELGDPTSVLVELHRVLKTDGVLSFSDHHMKEKDILARITVTGLFKLATMGKRTYRFVKAG